MSVLGFAIDPILTEEEQNFRRELLYQEAESLARDAVSGLRILEPPLRTRQELAPGLLLELCLEQLALEPAGGFLRPLGVSLGIG